MPPFQNLADPSSEEIVSGRTLQEAASQSAGAYVAQAVSGQNPATYDQGWADVADQFKEQFPNIDPERAQSMYEQARQQSAVSGLTFTPQGGQESSERTLAGRIPIFGMGHRAEQNRRDTEALQRIRDGGATLDDYAQVRQMQGHNEFSANRSNYRMAGDTIVESLAFGADLAAAHVMTSGLGGFALPGIGRVAAVTPLGARTLQGAATGVALAQATPGRLMERVSGHQIPDVSRDENGNLHIGGNKTWGDAFQGYLDHQIEIWSEMSGEALLHGGGYLIGRIPGAARAQAVATGLAARVATNPGLRASLNHFGYSNMLGEFLEERAGELAKGITGASNDFGMTGDVAAGRWQQALNQLAVEGMAFGGMQVGVTGASMAMNRVSESPGNVAVQALQRQGISRDAAHAQVMTAATSIANGTAQPGDVRPGPLRTLAEAVHERVQEAEKTPTQAQAAVEEAKTGEAPRIRPAAEGTQQPGFMRQAENVVPNAQVPGSPEPGTAPTGQNLTSPSSAGPSAPAAHTVPQAVPAPSAARMTAPAPQVAPQTTPGALNEGLPGLWLRHFSGEAGIRSQINAAADLSEREAGILWGRLPKERGGDGRTLAAIGREQGVSRERVRQIEEEARGKAAFDVSVHQFKKQAEGLVQEGSALARQTQSGRSDVGGSWRANVLGTKEGFQSRKAKVEPADAIQDQMIAILEEADKSGRPLTEFQRQAVHRTYLDLMTRIDNDTTAAKRRGLSVARIEKAFRAVVEATENGIPHEQTGNPNPQADQAGQPAAGAQGPVQANPAVPGRSLITTDQPGSNAAPIASGRLTPTHAALLSKMAASLQASALSPEKQAEYNTNLQAVLSNFNEKFVSLALANLKSTNWHVSTKALTDTLALVDADIAQERRQGKQVGGAFKRDTGELDLDGDAPNRGRVAGLTGAQIKAHEFGHVIDGLNLVFSSTSEWAQAQSDEAPSLGVYAQKSAQEAFAEFSRLVGSGASAESLRETYPKMTAFWVTNGLLGQGGGVEAQPLEQIFDKAINNGPFHADMLKRSLITVPSKEFAAARAQVNPTGVADPTATTNAEAAKANAATFAFEFRQRADDNKAIATEIAVAAAKKRARLGLAPAKNDLRTVITRADQSVQPWAEKIASEGAFVLDQAPDGTRTARTIGKPVAWVTEGLNYAPDDFKPSGAGVIDRLKRKFGFPVEQGASRFSTMVMALHAVHQVERGQAMLDKYLTFITPEQEAVATRLINTVSTEQLKAFDAYVEYERNNDREFFSNANESLRRLAQLNDWTLESLQSVGWYSAEDVARIKRDFPDYVSMARIIEGDELRKGGGSEIKPGWEKKRHGSDKQILDPIKSLDSRYAQTAIIIAKQLKDQALLEAARSLEGEYLKPASITPEVRLTDIAEKLNALGIDKAHQAELIGVIGPELIEHFGMPKWDENGQNFYIMRENGQRVAMEITSKPLYDLMTSNQEATALVSGITRFINAIPGLAKIPKIVKWGATTGNLVFPVRNLLKDPWHAIQNREGPLLPTLGRLIVGLKDSFKASAQVVGGYEISDAWAKLYFEATGQQLREFAYTKGGAGAEAFGKLKGESAAVRKTVKVAQKVQEVLELIGFAEHGPRLAAFGETLEKMGYTKTEVAAAMKADPMTSPIPMDVVFTALQRAAERTTDFSRQGIDTREFNRIAPFFSPQIAGMSQEIRNWNKAAGELKQGKFGRASKSMLGTLAMYLGFELMHWWRYKDDPWYKNLPPHLRYSWWVLGQTKDGATWGVPKPQGIMLTVGAYLQELLRTASKSDPRFGMATSFVADQNVPRVLPVGVAEAYQVSRNKDWRGANIIPARDLRELSAWDQFRRFQLPYVLDQMTGGLASARVLRGPHEAFQSSKMEPNLPVNEYFTRLEAATGAHQLATRTHKPLPPEQAREYARLHYFEQSIRRLSQEARGERGPKPGPERLREIRRLQNVLARRALGLEPT